MNCLIGCVLLLVKLRQITDLLLAQLQLSSLMLSSLNCSSLFEFVDYCFPNAVANYVFSCIWCMILTCRIWPSALPLNSLHKAFGFERE